MDMSQLLSIMLETQMSNVELNEKSATAAGEEVKHPLQNT